MFPMAMDLSQAQFERKPSGTIVIDGQEVAHTLMCCHCNEHFISIRGSGKKRGYCFRCGKVTCGKRKCMKCIPLEAKIEYLEAQEGREKSLRKLLNRFPDLPLVSL